MALLINKSENKSMEKSLSYFDYSRDEMLSLIPLGTNKILDIGCGSGRFGKLAKDKFKAEVWGIEISKEASCEARKHIDNVITADCLSAIKELPESYFDCIVLNDILEHLEKPDILLDNIKKCIAPNGCIVASIPNVRYFENLKELLIDKDWRYREQGILDSTHLRFYTKKSIVRMFESVGYSFELLKGINPLISKKFELLNLILLGTISDSKYLQFALRAKIIKY